MNYRRININEHSYIGLLNLNELTDTSKRQRENNGARALLKEMLESDHSIEVAYHDTGKPYLKGRTEHISISHSHDMLAIIVDKISNTGVDIELIRDKVLKIIPKFLSDKEQKELGDTNIEKSLVYWAAKETLYKIYGEKQVDFKEHLAVDSFDYNEHGGKISANISMPVFKRNFTLHYQKVNNYILVYPA